MSSSNNASLVPILDGTNYRIWAVAMKALIQSTSMWAYVMGKVSREYFPDDDAEFEKLTQARKDEIMASINKFKKNDGMVLGQITLRLSPTIQQNHQHCPNSASLWNALKVTYSKSMASTVFKDFKDCLNGRIYTNADPQIYFDKVYGAYACMKAADVAVPPQLQVMIALAALPQKWEMLISIVTGNNPLEDLILSDMHTAVITQFQADSVRHGSKQHNANKISAATQTGVPSKGPASSSSRTSSSKVLMAKPSESMVNVLAKARPKRPISLSSIPTSLMSPLWRPPLPPPLHSLLHLGCKSTLSLVLLLSSVRLALTRPSMLQLTLLKPLGLSRPSKQ